MSNQVSRATELHLDRVAIHSADHERTLPWVLLDGCWVTEARRPDGKSERVFVPAGGVR
jgi:hypothetical protein